MNCRVKISEDRLRRIVNEEIQSLDESIDHNGVREVVNVSSKLLKAVEAFEDKAPDAAKNALLPYIDYIRNSLEDMVQNPSSYISTRRERQHVTLKPTSSAK